MSTSRVPSNEKILCVMPTFQCTAECKHCGTQASPRANTWLALDQMNAAIDQAATAGYCGVVFSGGEPTLAGENLLLAMRRAALQGLSIRLVTNAWWAVNSDAARRQVDDLVSNGLIEINFSTGEQHARFVPLENIFHATRAAVAAGLSTVIIVEIVKERLISKDSIEAHPEFKRILEEFPYSGITVTEWAWSPLSPFTVGSYPDGLAVNKENLSHCIGCESVLSTTTIQPDGTINPCCGLGIRLIPELRIGNIREIDLAEADRVAASDPIKQWIRAEGPERILAWAATYDTGIEWENMYAHRCQACIRLHKDRRVRKVITEYIAERRPLEPTSH